jgi:hypothetical protein
MRGVHSEQLTGGACLDLSPAVIDKYFLASQRTERFEHVTAKSICAGCIVRVACLADAIVNPQPQGVRGGESPEAVRALNYQHHRERTPAAVLAAQAIGWSLNPLRGAYGEKHLRAGHMPDMALIMPEGGAEL